MVELHVADGMCTAVLGQRSSEISCGEVGKVGLYVNGRVDLKEYGPLDWLAPRTAWRDVLFQDESHSPWQKLIFPPTSGWQRMLGEWRYEGEQGATLWSLPGDGDFRLDGILRRPYQEAGILLLPPSDDEGWVFIVSGANRQGVWWRWQDGRPVEPLLGIPFEKSLRSQAQALLRQILRTHQATLLLLGLGWLVNRINRSKSRQVGENRVRLLWRLGQEENSCWLVATMMGLVLVTTAVIATAVLGRIPHVQDSATYLFQAQTMARGKLWAPAPAETAFFEQEFLLVQDGRWFGKYPPGYPLLLALGVLAGRPWLVNPILATATVLLLYLVGKELYGRTTGLLAILLMLTSPFFLFMSGSMMAHTAELFWTTLCLWSWLRGMHQASWRWVVVAGVALGFLFLTRQITAVIVAGTFMVITSFVAARATSWRLLGQKIAFLVGIVGCFGLLLMAYQAAVTGSPFTDPRLLYWDYDRLGFGPDVGEGQNAFTVSLTEDGVATSWYTDPDQPPRGHTVARGLFNTGRNWQSLLENLYGWPPLLSLVFIWLLWLRQRLKWQDLALLALFGGTVAGYVAFWAAGIMYGPRYYYAALPALLLLTARGIQAVYDGGQGSSESKSQNRWLQWAVTGLVMALVATNLLWNMPDQWQAYQGYNFVTRPDLEKLAALASGPALVFVTDEGGWWEYGRYFNYNSPWLDGRFVFARDLGDEANGRLLAHFPYYQAFLWQDDELVQMTPPTEHVRQNLTSK